MTRNITTLLAAAVMLTGTARAVVDEAHAMIMEAVIDYVDQDFMIRADYWSGEIESGKQKLIRHQLFRGNEYWFWLGTSYTDCELQIEVYDGEGQAVSVERTQSESGFTAGVRVVPSSTDSYYILVKVISETEDTVDWAVAYGYR